MKLYAIDAGSIKLDGGAMFGVVPKTLWQKTNPADDLNRIDIALRLLLIEIGNRLILIDTGMGMKQSEKFFTQMGAEGIGKLENELHHKKFHTSDITDVFLTHLHFDHVGGAVIKNASGLYIPQFSQATYWSNTDHWNWAIEPNPREKASFLIENIKPIQESGQLNLLPTQPTLTLCKTPQLPFDYFCIDGHTEKQMLPLITYKEHTILFAADLFPTLGHLKIPYVMGYDVRPLQTLVEKEFILSYCAQNNIWLFLEHDPINELIKVKKTEKGYECIEITTVSQLV